VRVRFRLHRKTPGVLLLGLLCLFWAWWAEGEYEVSSAGWFLWGGFVAGVLVGIAEHVRTFRRGRLPEPYIAPHVEIGWRIGFAVLLIAVKVLDLRWAWVAMGGFGAGLSLVLSVRPDLPERKVPGRRLSSAEEN
jgi:hypothetical protein